MSDSVRVIGRRPLPPAPLLRFDQLAHGQQDGQRIAVRGIIRSAVIAPSWGRQVLFLTIDLGTDLISARVHDFAAGEKSATFTANCLRSKRSHAARRRLGRAANRRASARRARTVS